MAWKKQSVDKLATKLEDRWVNVHNKSGEYPNAFVEKEALLMVHIERAYKA